MTFDFIINQDIFNITIFRFNPDKSRVYEDEDKSLKIYYNWEILWQLSKNEPIVLFNIDDENSALTQLVKSIKYALSKPNQTVKLNTNGEPGSDWKIIYKQKTQEFYFEVFNNFFDNGFRFTISLEETHMFMDYLNKINNYMLNKNEFV